MEKKTMNEKVFTFWEGKMPGYIRACLSIGRNV